MNPEILQSGRGSLAWYRLGTGKPVLILHGWGTDSKVMMPLAKQIQDLRTCYLIDFPGFGKSPEPETAWTVDDFADAIEEFIKEEIGEPELDLIVHSFGGRVALKLLTRPGISSKMDKVVFTGAAGLKPKRSASFYIRKYTAKLLKLPFYLLPSSLRKKGLDRLRSTALWKRLGSSDYQKLSGVMRDTFVACVNEHLDSYLPKIKQEILLVWGRDDISTPLEQGERMDYLLPESALVIIDNAGHYAFLDKPKHFASIVKAYFEE